MMARRPKGRMSEDRRRRYWRGIWAERAAAIYLMFKGYRIVARRFRSPVGEIDLIAVRGTRIAFVEVKWRRRREDAAFAIIPRQRQRLRRAAEDWLRRNPSSAAYHPAIDAVYITWLRWPEHIRDILA